MAIKHNERIFLAALTGILSNPTLIDNITDDSVEWVLDQCRLIVRKSYPHEQANEPNFYHSENKTEHREGSGS